MKQPFFSAEYIFVYANKSIKFELHYEMQSICKVKFTWFIQ